MPCQLAATGTLKDLRRPDFSDLKAEVTRFYEAGGLAWTAGGFPTRQAEAIISVLQDAETKGLDPEDYDSSRWDARLAQFSNIHQSLSATDASRFDLLLTVSLMRYASDLHFGRLNPGLYHRLDPQLESFDLPGLLRQLATAETVGTSLADMEPPFDGYRRTQIALQRYLALARTDDRADGGRTLPVTSKPLEPGDTFPALAQLTRLLQKLGDLPRELPIASSPDVYEGTLVDGVKHFQQRHGLDPDGRIGRATFVQLNTPLRRRVRQLQLTLERWRWVPHSFSRPPIVVNIPEFRARAINASYRTELDMKVVVGRAFRHQTPVFSASLTHLIFRPYWEVPLSIQRNELVPKIERDRGYLAENGYEVVTTRGQVVEKGMIGDSMLAELRSGSLKIRQVPGPKNSLGLVKFLFPNEHSVYMHDTPATELFAKSRRDFSHGCIRLEKPALLAEWVLRGKPEWTPERIAEAMNGTKTVQVNLNQPIPVLIVYATAVVLESGEVRFFEDIYGQDAALEKRLARGYAILKRTPSLKKPPTSGAPVPRPHE